MGKGRLARTVLAQERINLSRLEIQRNAGEYGFV